MNDEQQEQTAPKLSEVGDVEISRSPYRSDADGSFSLDLWTRDGIEVINWMQMVWPLAFMLLKEKMDAGDETYRVSMREYNDFIKGKFAIRIGEVFEDGEWYMQAKMREREVFDA